jgi:hypothetical protein
MKKLFILTFAILTLISCSKDDDNINVDQTSIELYSKDYHQITTNQDNPIYTSEDEFVAQVSSDGLVTAKHLGKTYIDINGSRKVEVTVKAKYDIHEPLHDFSLTKSQILKDRGSNCEVDDSSLFYMNPATGIVAEIYLFSNSSDKLKSSAILYSTTDFVEINDALLERYQPIAFNEDEYYVAYIDAANTSKAKTVILSKMYDINYSITMYAPYDEKDNTSKVMKRVKRLSLPL